MLLKNLIWTVDITTTLSIKLELTKRVIPTKLQIVVEEKGETFPDRVCVGIGCTGPYECVYGTQAGVGGIVAV